VTAYSSIPTSKRIQVLDILRGFALLGILVANLSALPTAGNILSVWVYNIVSIFTVGSFYPLFSLLFGIGFAIWMDKSMKKNGGPWRFLWRSLILFVIGCCFYVFIWDAAILIRYSILSIPLLLFYRAGKRTLLVGAAIVFMFTIFHQPIMQEIDSLKSSNQKLQEQKQWAKIDSAWTIAENNKEFKSYAKARFMEMPQDIKGAYTLSTPMISIIFCMFLLGAFFWRNGSFTASQKSLAFWRKIFWPSLIIGLGGNIFLAISTLAPLSTNHLPNRNLLRFIDVVANPALTFFYISLFVMLYQKLKDRKNLIFTALSATGRMAFTNYIMQFVFGVAIGAPYFFDISKRLLPQHLLLIALSIFIFQVVFSMYWMKHFIYGPMEWIWRSLTYMKFQSLKRENKKILSSKIELVD
jgi:uncharacterized protein